MTGNADRQKRSTFFITRLSLHFIVPVDCLKCLMAKELIRNVCSGRNIAATAVVSDFFNIFKKLNFNHQVVKCSLLVDLSSLFLEVNCNFRVSCHFSIWLSR